MKIAEVSEQFGISSDTLRNYERIGLIPHLNRNESGIREYRELDTRRVEFIKCMWSAGLPVEVLIEYGEIKMQKRKPGQSGLDVSALGLGCMRTSFGDAPVGYRAMSERKAIQVMIDF